MKRAKIIKLLLVLCVIFTTLAGLTACLGDKNAQKNQLTFEVVEEITIGYYEYCEVPTVVAKDSLQNMYFPICVVKSPTNEEVAIEDGRFFVLKEGDYTFEYTLEFNGKTITKTTKAKVVDRIAPEFITVLESKSVFNGTNVSIFSVEYEDNKDSAEDITLDVAVSLNGQEIEVNDNAFVTEDEGEYVIEYTITDKAGNSNSVTVSVYSLEKEDGEIAYFYESGSLELCSLTEKWSANLEFSDSANYPLSKNGLALKISEAGGIGYAGVILNNPAIKDITAYDYLYIDVYNPQTETVKFWINYIYDVPYIEILPQTWTRVVAQKNGDNFDMQKVSGKISDTGDGSKDIFYPGELGGVPNPSASDISRIDVGMCDALNKTLFVGQMRVVDELPTLPEGIVYAIAPKATLLIDEIVRLNTKHKLEYAKEDIGDASITYTVSVNNAQPFEVVENQDFLFDAEGEYEFVATVMLNGKVIGKSVKKINCVDAKGEIASFTDANVVNINNLETYASYGVYTTTTTFGYNTTNVTRVNGADFEVAGIILNNPITTNVADYKYIYIDVYAEQCDINFAVNYQYGSPFVKVKQGEWKRIVLQNDNNGDFIMLNKDGNISAGSTDKVFNGYEGEYVTNHQLSDLSGLKLVAQTDQGWRCFLIGVFSACNSLPELPENVTYANYTAN